VKINGVFKDGDLMSLREKVLARMMKIVPLSAIIMQKNNLDALSFPVSILLRKFNNNSVPIGCTF
jgi:hypothetical protein